MQSVAVDLCHCGEVDCDYFAFRYPWCRPCGEHHRPPECPVNQDGESLAPCGCTWASLEVEPYAKDCPHL